MIEQERYVITAKQLNALRLELHPEIITDLKKVLFSSELQKEREGVLDELFVYAHNRREEFKSESKHFAKVAPHLHDKMLCLSCNESMCGMFKDEIESLRIKKVF